MTCLGTSHSPLFTESAHSALYIRILPFGVRILMGQRATAIPLTRIRGKIMVSLSKRLTIPSTKNARFWIRFPQTISDWKFFGAKQHFYLFNVYVVLGNFRIRSTVCGFTPISLHIKSCNKIIKYVFKSQ